MDDRIVYEGALPKLSGNYRLVNGGHDNYYILYHGTHDGWRHVSSNSEYTLIAGYAFTEALKLALTKSLKENVQASTPTLVPPPIDR